MVRNGGILALAVGGVNRGPPVLFWSAANRRCASIVANPGQAPGGSRRPALDGLRQTG
jgi:hypothetical protein